MTQAAKDRKGFLILGAASGDFSKGRKESTKTGMYWVRPEGFLARMVSSSPSAASSSPSSCKHSHPRRQVSRALLRDSEEQTWAAQHSHLLQPPPDLRLLVQLGLQHLLLLAGQLHLLFYAFLLLYLLKVMNKAIPSPENRPPSLPQRKASLGTQSAPYQLSVCDLGPQIHHVATPPPTKSIATCSYRTETAVEK